MEDGFYDGHRGCRGDFRVRIYKMVIRCACLYEGMIRYHPNARKRLYYRFTLVGLEFRLEQAIVRIAIPLAPPAPDPRAPANASLAHGSNRE